ncbi:hypothetical protein CPZ06_10165 [Lactobacillus acidophilus]|nr:hypothetical protein CPZ06_10165 [Lactobacillus acidophilus]
MKPALRVLHDALVVDEDRIAPLEDARVGRGERGDRHALMRQHAVVGVDIVPVDLDVFDLTGEGVDQDGFDIGHRRDFRFVSRL